MVDAHADYSRLAEVAGGLGLHEHLCLIYNTQEEQLAAALPYLRTGLERGEKCLYIVDENTAATVLDALRQGGTNVDHYLRSGALTITHKRDTDLQQERFDPDWWLGFVNQAAAEAGSAGPSGLRILGDMSWALRCSNSTDKFIEFESRINHFVRDHDVRVICQYTGTRISPEVILGVIRTHPLVVYGGIVCKNPYYVPPDEFLKPDQASQEVDRLLNNILTWERTQQELRRSEDRLRLIIDTIPTMVWSVRPDGAVDFINKRSLDYMGLSLQEALEEPTRPMHPEDLPRVMERWRATIAAGEPSEDEMRLRRADGEYRWFLVRSVPLRDDAGSIFKWYGSSIDIEERKRAEEALRRSEARWRAVFENSAIGVALTDLNGRFFATNPVYQEMVGYTEEELRRLSFLDITHEGYRELNRALASELLEGKRRQFQIEKQYRRKNGSLVWVRNHVSLVPGTERVPRFVMALSEDITERKHAEAALRRSEAYLAAGQRLSHTGSWALNVSSEELFWSQETYRIFGFDPIKTTASVNETFLQRIHPEDRPKIEAEIKAAAIQQGSYEVDYRIVLADGSIKHIHDVVYPVTSQAGDVVERYGVIMDVTERKRAEERLREFEKVVEGLEEMIVVIDREYQYLIANRAYLNYRGLEREQVVGRSVAEVLNETVFKTVVKEKLDECFRGHGVKYELKSWFPEIGERDLSASYLPIESRQGIDRVAVVLLDITERKRAEEELQRSRDQLRALAARVQRVREEERTRVAREIHDELGQALTAIKIDLSSLCRELPADKKQRSVSILKLVDETIQSVRRISTELRPAILDAVGLVAAVEWAAEEFEARTGTKWRLDLPQEDLVIDQERATALFRIFQETLTNVARHAKATEVNVRLAKEDGNLTLEVHDNGEGVSEEQLSSGRSLGILGMRERASLLGGELTITGAAGEGTTVRVRIPVTHPIPPKDGV